MLKSSEAFRLSLFKVTTHAKHRAQGDDASRAHGCRDIQHVQVSLNWKRGAKKVISDRRFEKEVDGIASMMRTDTSTVLFTGDVA